LSTIEASDSLRTSIAVIVPSLDEQNTVSFVISKIHAAIPNASVVVVDGGSTDGTTDIVKSSEATLVTEAKRGYGRAIRAGIKSVDADFYMILDADDTYDTSAIATMMERARHGKVVVGRRLTDGRNMSLSHRIGNRVLSLAFNLMYDRKMVDTQSGFKVFPSQIAKLLKEDGMTLSLEIILLARHLNMEVEEIPVAYHPRHSNSESKFLFWKDGIPVFMFLLTRRWLRSHATYGPVVTGQLGGPRLKIPENAPGPVSTERH